MRSILSYGIPILAAACSSCAVPAVERSARVVERRQKQLLKSTLTAAALLTPAIGAHADVQLQASMTNLQLQLIDLDTTDGITPAITFSDGYSGSWAIVNGEGGNVSKSEAIPSLYQSIATSVTAGPVKASGSAQGTGDLTSAMLASNLTFALDTPGSVTSGNGFAYFSSRFSLTAHTQLVISGLVTMDVHSSMTGKIDNQINVLGSVGIQGPGGFDDYYRSETNLVPPRTAGIFDRHKEALVTTGFSNDTSNDVSGSILFNASSYQQLLPIPEPGSAALLLSGLGLIAFRVKRHLREVEGRHGFCVAS